MIKHLFSFLMLTCLAFNSYSQLTNIYQPNGTSTIFGRATNDSLNYYVSFGYSPFSVKRIDGNNAITQVCDLPAMTNQLFFNNNKGIYKTSSGYFLYDGSNHNAIPATTIPATYPFNTINEDFFHIGASTYFENGKNVFRTDFSAVANIQVLYTAAATTVDPSYYAIIKMYNTGNSIYFSESGNPFIPTPNLLKRINLATGIVTIVDSLGYSALGMPIITHNNSLYYSIGSTSALPFGVVKKVDDNGIVSVLYAGTALNNTISAVLGVIPNGVIGYTTQNELVLISGGTALTLNHNITTSPLPRVSAFNGKSTNALVYYQAFDSVPTNGPAVNALWVTDGTLAGTKKVIPKNDYYSGVASFGDVNSMFSSVVCGNDLYFPGQKTVSSQLNLFYVNGADFTYTINENINSVQQLYKNPNGGIYMKGSPALAQFAVYKTVCSGVSAIEEFGSDDFIFDVYPNPSKGQIQVQLGENRDNCTLTVYNVLGELLHSSIFSGQSTDLDLDLKTGLYFVSLKSKGQIVTKKLIVE